MSSTTTKGKSPTSSAMCPRRVTVSFEAVAARAERKAKCISLCGIFFAIFFPTTGGLATRPPTVPTANVAF